MKQKICVAGLNAVGILLFCLFLSSCSKDLTNREAGMSTTTNPGLRADGTGITLSQAEKVAVKYMRAMNSDLSANISVKNSLTITKSGIPYFHVVNMNAGFVILSSDSLYDPVLAYDSTGNFPQMQKTLIRVYNFGWINTAISLNTSGLIRMIMWILSQR